MVELTYNEFLERTGIDLSKELNDNNIDMGVDQLIDVYLKRWTKYVYRLIDKVSITKIPNDDELSYYQINAIKDAICELGMYNLGYTQDEYDNIDEELIRMLNSVRRKSLGRRAIW